ncbi:hypothetical protein JXB02_06325 [Candidatus Woesearchaeota archaeon]|nr:hypothetical protein [Candidatus Woesearchaeota archaeon]
MRRKAPAPAEKRRRRRYSITWPILSFGFLNGLFLALNINPKADAFSYVGHLMEGLGPWGQLISLLIPQVFFVVIVALIYGRAGKGGIFAVVLAFAGGLSALLSWYYAAGMLLLALFIGSLSVRPRS